MKMTLEFAISHAKEAAARKQIEGCCECADEHFQLASWLEELKSYKATGLTPEEVERLKEYMMPFTIESMDRFREIMQAEKEGRLAILHGREGDSTFSALIQELRSYTYWLGKDEPCSRDIHPPICDVAADAIQSLLGELERPPGAADPDEKAGRPVKVPDGYISGKDAGDIIIEELGEAWLKKPGRNYWTVFSRVRSRARTANNGYTGKRRRYYYKADDVRNLSRSIIRELWDTLEKEGER